MDYFKEAKYRIDLNKLPKNYKERLSPNTRKVVELNNYVVDVHSHIFDIHCINKSYFIIRFIKDFLGLKSNGEEVFNYDVEDAYKDINNYESGWEIELLKELKDDSVAKYIDKSGSNKGFIDILKATKFLSFKKMSSVYNNYIRNYSLSTHFNLPNTNVISTALSMDLEIGWNTKIKKTFYKQIEELKHLALEKPILPFLFCDPRRADLIDNQKNLYSIFNYAFCEGQSFFGIKIYPALGYDPFDYRLWPIYEICQKYSIPVLTHCGGESISTNELELEIYVGERKEIITAKNRKGIAKILNNPKRWESVLSKFPKLKLNFGHFGGYDTWDSSSTVSSSKDPQQRKESIFKLMEKYPNVYADFAFNFVEEKLSGNLLNVLVFKEIVRKRTLFGTDYWMVTPKGDLKTEQKEFIERLKSASTKNKNLVNMLIVDNPRKYLFD